MLDDQGVEDAADLLNRLYGEAAISEARTRIATFAAAGDAAHESEWKRILKAVERQRSEGPLLGEWG